MASSTDYAPAPERERWGSRLGLILAMAGNAVGLGNFLRFPNQAVQNGRGAFMVAYFVSLLLLGIPLMWMEWGIGRRGGVHGHSTCPGMFATLTKARWVKYLGAIGVVMPLLIVVYYVYIESWTLGYAVNAASGALAESDAGTFFSEYLAQPGGFLGHEGWSGSPMAYGFFLVTMLVNLWVLSRGLSKGIEIVAKIGMPVLLLCAVGLVARVLTLDGVDGRDPLDGLAIYWQPEWRALFDNARAAELFGVGKTSAAIWLAAAGQIFFTLSVGSGAINTYSSYLTAEDDIALTGLATVSTNEFCEVVLGGTLAIPAAFVFLGMSGVMEASSGNMGLAFVVMPEVFAQVPLFGGSGGATSVAVFGTIWFGLLFVAGITSSLALSQPAMAFLEGAMGLTRRKAAVVVGVILLIAVQPVILVNGVLDEIDYWAGTFGLVIFSTIEVVLFMWVFGPNNAWNEIHRGAEIRIPRFFKFIMTYVTPAFLLFMLYRWGSDAALPILNFENDPNGKPYTEATTTAAWIGRIEMLALFAFFAILVGVAARRGHYKDVEGGAMKESA